VKVQQFSAGVGSEVRYCLVCTVHNGNRLDQRSGIVWYVLCITVTGWIRGQVLFHLTVFIFVACRWAVQFG